VPEYSGMTDKFIIRHWLNSLLVERLEQKSSAIIKIFSATEMTGRKHSTEY
jgi:hypothetical protein